MLPTLDIFNLYELKVRTICTDWFVGIDKDSKRAYLFNINDIDKIIFFKRSDALNVIKEAEKVRPKKRYTISYEEY